MAQWVNERTKDNSVNAVSGQICHPANQLTHTSQYKELSNKDHQSWPHNLVDYSAILMPLN